MVYPLVAAGIGLAIFCVGIAKDFPHKRVEQSKWAITGFLILIATVLLEVVLSLGGLL
jgi:hypothetical protein